MNTPGPEHRPASAASPRPLSGATEGGTGERLRVYQDAGSALVGAAEEFVRRATAALSERGRFVTLLCAGERGRSLYRCIAERAGALRGAPICLVVGEELRVGPDDDASCFRAAWEELAAPLDLGAGQVWRFFSEGPDPEFTVEWFQEMLQRALGPDLMIDLAVVTLGPDGRLGGRPTPSTAVAHGRWAAKAGDGSGAAGFAVTPAMLSRSRCAMFVGLGDACADAALGAMDGTAPQAPAARVAAAETLWVLDRFAARRPASAFPALGAFAAQPAGTAPSPQPPASTRERELVEGLRRGDDRVFESLVREHAPRLLAAARRVVHDPDEARDVVQEAFLSAWRHRERFKGDSLVSTWLHRITVNAALMRLRRRKPQLEQPLDDLLPRFVSDGHMIDPAVPWRAADETGLERRERALLVRRCIDELPDSYRTVLMLRDIEDVDVREAAGLLGISTNAVNIRLHRARQALRALLDPHLRGMAP